MLSASGDLPILGHRSDRDAIEYAIDLLKSNRVIAAPIVPPDELVGQEGEGADPAVVALAADLATNGVIEGRLFRFNETDLGLNIAAFVRAQCVWATDCDGDGVLNERELGLNMAHLAIVV